MAQKLFKTNESNICIQRLIFLRNWHIQHYLLFHYTNFWTSYKPLTCISIWKKICFIVDKPIDMRQWYDAYVTETYSWQRFGDFQLLYAAERTDFDSTLLCVVFWLPSLFQMQAGLRVASCLVQWWISNCTSASLGSDCSCNQSVQQRWYRGVWHRATVPECKQEPSAKPAHTWPHDSSHLPLFLRSPRGGRTRSPDHMWPLCLLQSLSANSIPLSGVSSPGSSGQTARLHTQEACGSIEHFFPFPNPFSLSLVLLFCSPLSLSLSLSRPLSRLLSLPLVLSSLPSLSHLSLPLLSSLLVLFFVLHWEQIKPRSSSPDSLQFISFCFLC